MLRTNNAGHVPVKSIYDYFSSHQQLKIPAWQRDYSWDASDDGEVGDLIDDLNRHVKDDESAEYLLGSVILCDSDEATANSWLIIDGQQRSMTLSLFLLCALKHIQKHELISAGANQQNVITFTKLLVCLNVNAQQDVPIFKPRLAMNNREADLVINEVWAWAQATQDSTDLALASASKTQTERNIREVADYIFKKMEHGDVFPGSDFLAGISKILNTIKIVELTLDNRREALKVYDRINNRGLSLSSASLVKNQIFMNITDAEFDNVSSSWLDMSKELVGTGKARLQDPSFLLRMMASTKSGEKLTYDDLVDYWAAAIDAENGTISAVKFAEDLFTNAKHIKALASTQVMREETGLANRIEVGELFLPHELGSLQHYSMLLAGLHLTDVSTVRRLGQQVAHRALLYVFTKERTGQFESIVPKWSNQISVLPADASPKDVDEVYERFAFHPDGPVDLLKSNLRGAIENWDYRNSSDRKKIRATLALLNLDLAPNDYSARELMRTRKRAEEKRGWDIEHIMPKTLSDEKYVNNIGNLTLLAPNENASAGANLPIDKASSHIYNQSTVFLTKILDGMEMLTVLQRNQVANVFTKRNLQASFSLENWGAEAASARLKFISQWLEEILVKQYL